jgi:type I site-specific restriction endonuclease
MRKHNLLNKSIGTLNNNAVAVAENSSASINQALAQMSGSSAVVGEYTNSISSLLAEVRANAEEKKQLQTMLANVQYYLDTAKQANVEFSNELAELIVLSNIPNAKKDEFYARHRAAIDALNAVVPVLVQEEVTADEGNEA